MTGEIELKIEAIDHTSPHLSTVMELGRANKKTLGFLRDSAFVDYAKRRGILVALSPQGACMGYVMYRRPHQQIAVAHLCVDPAWRGKNVAKKLVDYLSQANRELYGIGLWCRRDYQVSHMWPKLGFVAKGDKPGRSQEGKLLTFWWLDHEHPTLFSTDATQRLESKLRVVLDANVFFDLHADDDIDREESKSLLADWLQPDLDLCLTDEIDNEINRIANSVERDRQWKLARQFTRLTCHRQVFEEEYSSLRTLFPEKMKESDESALRQLARTIASDVQLFVTRDEQLLNIANRVYKNYGLSIVQPTELIVQIDELGAETEYQPVRLAGTHIEKQRVHRGQEFFLTDAFQSAGQGETKTDFLRCLRRFIADSEEFECFVVLEGQQKLLALIVYGRGKEHELEIPLLRVGRSPLAATIARHLILRAILLSAREQQQFTRITDPYLEENVALAIQEDAFVRVKNGWLRANLAVALNASQLSLRLTNLATEFGQEYDFCRELANILNTDSLIKDGKIMAQIERFLWPAKIIDAEIPTFIIPIKPNWAKDLFDEELASQTLFGANELALNREAVYYRTVKAHGGLTSPARILWYVSNEQGYYGVKQIRACSRLDEVIVGKPKDLFRRFQRLGIYDWSNVYEVAGKLDNDIMAIRFRDTEMLNNPIPLNKLQQILGQNAPIQSPRRISNQVFERIYNEGIQK